MGGWVVKIIDNGSLLKIAPNEPNIVNKIETGKMIVEGGKVYKSESDFMRERKKYSNEGIVMVTIIIDKDYSINKNIIISNYGLPIDNYDKILDFYKIEFLKEYLKISNEKKENIENIKTISKRVIRKYCKNQFNKFELKDMGFEYNQIGSQSI